MAAASTTRRRNSDAHVVWNVTSRLCHVRGLDQHVQDSRSHVGDHRRTYHTGTRVGQYALGDFEKMILWRWRFLTYYNIGLMSVDQTKLHTSRLLT